MREIVSNDNKFWWICLSLLLPYSIYIISISVSMALLNKEKLRGYHQWNNKETTWNRLSAPYPSSGPRIINLGFLEYVMSSTINEIIRSVFKLFMIRFYSHKKHKENKRYQKVPKSTKKYKNTTKQKHQTQISEQT